MDRVTWYTPGESMEDLLCQAGNVGIYDGDLKHSAFEQGTASLTLQRLIWADSSDPDCRLILHHSFVKKLEKHNKSMFSRGGKVIVHLHSPARGRANNGPVTHSPYNSVRFVFRGGGEDEFFRKYNEALARETWKRNSSSSSSAGSRNSQLPLANRGIGIAGIEKKLADNHTKTNDNISQAFEDMSKLMEYARDMVGLSKSITEKLRMKKGEITDDETVLFKQYLLSLGVSDPVTKSTFGNGAKYFEKLAQEISTVLEKPLSDCGGMMTLPDAYCRINRARGMELLSPEDLLNACEKLDAIRSPLSLHRFDTGVMVVQLRSRSVEKTVDETYDFVKANGYVTPNQLAAHIGITVILARERLLAAEAQAKLCRDDSVEGLVFYPNRFLELQEAN
ncbi:hypothetical protein L596_025460 [Steinernema carpocapsae]|uniref:Vacuolar protein-sorting-associated protein 36 n=1 Tax=Steinernema carpocapsae TaxID=34508 RepID=A0A4U5M7V2_STECR|nr:hypothetical protein L596_025460 [Steinernema carpocapsae]